jgi:hypothetical protein
MGTMDAAPGAQEPQQTDQAPLRIFVNYRNDDTWGEALLLHDRLATRFGSDNVFLDARDLQPGMKWLEEIKSHRASCGVLLALIGPHWLSIMKMREQAAVAQPADDYVRFEIEYALRRDSGINVIPVLVGDAVPFTAEPLPRSLQELAKIEVEQVRQKRFEEDVAHLIARLEAIAREQPPPPLSQRSAAAIRAEERDPAPIHPGADDVAPQPDAAHCALVLKHMVNEGDLVPFLGSRLMGGHPDSPNSAKSLPDAEELAADLAERFGLTDKHLDLPEIAQYVYMTHGSPDLYRTLRQILTTDCQPGPVHRFLARFPQMLEALGLEKRYQLIVSTNFDNALEQAFDDEKEPYDLAFYMASGSDKGKFVHFPYDSEPEAIASPNAYGKLPFGEECELKRSLILKIYGAVDGNVGAYRWKENYVITEDQYIDYLSRSPIENLVPIQILDKLSESHCLFFGYAVSDWNSRVFLKRIWRGERIGAKSWAVEPNPNVLDKEFWTQYNVDLYAANLAWYVNQLQKQLARREHASAEP